VVIQHQLGYTTWYAHLSKITTSVGQPVSTAPPLRGAQVERALRSATHHAQRHRRSRGPLLHCDEPARYSTARIDDCRLN
jgi:hypothetical protein